MMIHIPTLILVEIIVAFTTSILLAISWLQNQSARSLYLWSIANLTGAIAIGLFGLRQLAPELVTIHGAYIALFIATAMGWAGTRVFTGRSFSPWLIVAGPILWIVLAQFPGFSSSHLDRTIVSAAIVTTLVFASAFELWRFKSERLVSRYPAVVCLIVYSCSHLARIYIALKNPPTMQYGVLTDPFITFIALTTLIYIIAISFLRIALVKERAEAESSRAIATDHLTNAASRRSFFNDGELNLATCARNKNECTALVMDIDNFKSINDRWGHAAGDKVLQEFVTRVQSVLGRTVLFARLGGEEFVAMLADIEAVSAFFFAENVREHIAAKPFIIDGESVMVTVSIGMACAQRSSYDLDTLLKNADNAMYCAKHNGRNRIECAAPEDRSLQNLAAA